MAIISVGCELRYNVAQPTTFLLNVAPARTPHQAVAEESLHLDPPVDYEECRIGAEENRVFRLSVQPCELKIAYQARVDLNPEVDDPPQVQEAEYPALPPEVLPYLNPSRYCESDLLLRLAFQEFGQLQPGFSRVQGICNWTYDHLQYLSGSTDVHSTACGVLVQRAGVCRDYAHLAIALCRALCIPARYVSGYALQLQPPDFHGFFEAYLGDRWYLFDATRMAPVGGFVRIGAGRDASDASFATLIGQALMQEMKVWARDEAAQGGTPTPPSTAAISTA
ncbi:MAG: transglutaminase family protein [Pseudomonadota bacterium]|nr:transglutaminase family protein [Pseudomonadota bacterium]